MSVMEPIIPSPKVCSSSCFCVSEMAPSSLSSFRQIPRRPLRVYTALLQFSNHHHPVRSCLPLRISQIHSCLTISIVTPKPKLLKAKLIKIKLNRMLVSVSLAAFQVLSHMWLAAIWLDRADMGQPHHHRTSHWAALLSWKQTAQPSTLLHPCGLKQGSRGF